MADNKAAVWTGGRLDFAQWGAAGNAAAGAGFVGGLAVWTDHARQSFREGLPGAVLAGGLVDHFPDLFFQRDRFHILGEVIQTIDQRHWVSQGAERGYAKAGG